MAYSYSAISTYKKCPAKYNFAYNRRLPRGPAGPAAQRGLRLHQSVENLLLGKTDTLDSEIEHYEDFFKSLRDIGAEPETKWGVTDDWQQCGFDDEAARLRGIVDIRLPLDGSVALYELKTGKVYEEHMQQMNMYATVELAKGDTKEVQVIATYLDQNTTKDITYTASMLNEYKAMWNRTMDMIDAEHNWMANPQFSCKWCDYRKDNGGPCPF